MLNPAGIPHEVLNAKFHERKRRSSPRRGVRARSPSHQHAGRGTDIKLGGDRAGLASDSLRRRGLNPAEVEPEVYERSLEEARALTAEEHERVVAAGGLHIIGTERHDARRIDNQLRGRAGRQGDPGSSRFYLSLEDTLMKRFASDRVAGLMERLGLEGDVAIESRLVSKTIENAQSRVEGYNFDIRKRVVEYDDVINKQRETIYAERDKVLHNEDLGGTVMGFVEGEVDVLAEQHLGPVVDDWDIDGFARSVAALGITGEGLDADSLAELPTQDAVVDAVLDAAEANLAERQQRHGEQTWAMVERLVLLRGIDQLWVDHLTELDDFRRGVGLRGYGGTDPLVEFKREAFKLYEELRGFIRHQVASTIFRVNVQVQPATPPPARTMPMPTPQQMALLRAAAAQRALAAQRAAAAQTVGAAGGGVDTGTTNGSGPAVAASNGAIAQEDGGVAAEALGLEGEDLEMGAEDPPRSTRSRTRTSCHARGARPARGTGGVAGLATAQRRMTAPARRRCRGDGDRWWVRCRGSRSQAGSQRPLLVWVGAQVQEVPRPVTPAARSAQTCVATSAPSLMYLRTLARSARSRLRLRWPVSAA